MTAVFVAGSRAVSKLNAPIRERLDNIISQNLMVLVGDANGADKAVQAYFAKSDYRNVIVHCMEVCRNNIGQWPTQRYSADQRMKHDRHYYGIKDLAMARDASWGFMLWDGHSKGTLTNVVNLLSAKKKVLLYLGPRKSLSKLSTFDDLSQVLQTSGVEDVSALLSSLEPREPAFLPLAR